MRAATRWLTVPPAGGAGPENGGGLGVSGAHWKAGQRTQEQAKSAPQIGGQTLPGGQNHHVPTHGFDDPPPAHRGTQGHDGGTEQHKPAGHGEGLAHTAPWASAAPRRKTPRNFCPSWAPWRKTIAPAPASWPRRQRGREGCRRSSRRAAQAAHPPAQRHGEDQSQEYPSPGSSPDVVQPAGQGQGGPGEPGHQGMALTGGHPEAPGQDGPKDNGAQRRAESGESRGPVRAEVSDGVDGLRYCCVDCRHDEDAQQVAGRRQRDARRKERTPVDTTVAIAFGASVQPLTSTTASTSRQVSPSTGLWATCVKRSDRDKTTPPVPILRGQGVLYVREIGAPSLIPQ